MRIKFWKPRASEKPEQESSKSNFSIVRDLGLQKREISLYASLDDLLTKDPTVSHVVWDREEQPHTHSYDFAVSFFFSNEALALRSIGVQLSNLNTVSVNMGIVCACSGELRTDNQSRSGRARDELFCRNCGANYGKWNGEVVGGYVDCAQRNFRRDPELAKAQVIDSVSTHLTPWQDPLAAILFRPTLDEAVGLFHRANCVSGCEKLLTM